MNDLPFQECRLACILYKLLETDVHIWSYPTKEIIDVNVLIISS